MGLNESYLMVRSQILLMSPLSTIKQAYSIVHQDESKKILARVSINLDVLTALYSQNNQKSWNHNPKYKGKKPYIECKHCHLPGHKKDTCYKIHGYHVDFQFTKGKNGSKVKANQVQATQSAIDSKVGTNLGPVLTPEQYN